MEIKLDIRDEINIPENFKAVIKDNKIVFEKKQDKFKDGDILVEKSDKNYVVIFKGYQTSLKDTFYSYFNSRGLHNLN